MKKLFLLFIFLGPLFRLVFFFIHASGEFRFLAESPSHAIYPLPFSHIDAFALGAYISRFSIPRAKAQFLMLLVLLPVVGFAAQYLATGEIGAISAFGYPLLLPEAYQFIWGYTLLNYLFAVVIHGVARERWAVRFLEHRPLRYLGRISYGLYVYHYPIVWFAGRIADLGVEPPILKPLTALFALIGTILMASLSYSLIERPVLNLKDHYFSLGQPQKQDTPLAAPAEP